MSENKRKEYPDNWAELRLLAQDKIKQKIPARVDNWTHVTGGAETGATWKRNFQALDEVGFHMKTIHSIDTANVKTNINLLGKNLNHPVAIAPMASAVNDVSENGFVEMGEGAKIAGAAASIGYPNSTESVQKMVSTGAPVFQIIKPLKEIDKLIKLLRQAEDMNCFAVGVDTDSIAGLKPEGDKILFNNICRTLTLKELKTVRESVNVPFIIKGVMSVEDAQACLEIGADAIIVSNHAGFSLDYSLSSIEALPEIVDTVGEKMQIIFDSGIRRGSDILKAFALGADAVMIGRLALWGLAIGERDGLAWVLQLLEEELKRSMVLTGVQNLNEVNKSILLPLGDIGRNLLK